MHDCVWTRAVFIVWNLLEDTAQLQPWPCSLAYCQEVMGVCIGLNLCSKTVSWADVLFAYSCTATKRSLHHYASIKRYSPVNNDQPITYAEKRRTQSYHKILAECIKEVTLISTLITNSQFWFMRILDLISDDNSSTEVQEMWRSKQ